MAFVHTNSFLPLAVCSTDNFLVYFHYSSSLFIFPWFLLNIHSFCRKMYLWGKGSNQRGLSCCLALSDDEGNDHLNNCFCIAQTKLRTLWYNVNGCTNWNYPISHNVFESFRNYSRLSSSRFVAISSLCKFEMQSILSGDVCAHFLWGALGACSSTRHALNSPTVSWYIERETFRIWSRIFFSNSSRNNLPVV